MRVYCKKCGGAEVTVQRESYWSKKSKRWETVNPHELDGAETGYCETCQEGTILGVMEAVVGETFLSECSQCGGNQTIHEALFGFFNGKWEAFNIDTTTGYCRACDDYTKSVSGDADPLNGCLLVRGE